MTLIRSQGIGEVFINPINESCRKAKSSFFDPKKEIPFFKLLLEINSFCYKYWHNIAQENIFNRLCIVETDRASIKLLISFERIVDLCDSLYCTGDIDNIIDAILNFYKFINNEPFNFYDIFGELREIMDLIFIELEFFKKQLHKVMECCFYFIKKRKITI